MPLRKVILDANVIIPAALRDTLLRAAEVELYDVYWSEAILDEVQRNLVKNGLTTAQGAESLTLTLRAFFPNALVTDYENLIPILTNDPKDRHVLAAAIVTGASVIVTSNRKHFPRRATEPHSVMVHSPNAFLTGLFHVAPEPLGQIILDQAAALRKTQVTAADVLDRVALHAPTFATLVRERLIQQGSL